MSAWPRLSETLILNEVLGVERLGVRLQIFAVKDADDKSAHADAAEVRAPLTGLSMMRNRKAIGLASIRFFLGSLSASAKPDSVHCDAAGWVFSDAFSSDLS